MKANALTLVLELEQKREDEAAREFGQAKSQLSMQQRRLDGLVQYRQDYLQQANDRARQGMGSTSFGQYHAFVGKLDDGISQQQAQLQRVIEHVERLRQNWLSQQQRRKAVQHLLEKQHQQAEKLKSRQEQRTSDEFAMQGFLRRARDAK
ncbi:flagellar export protein FliJ [Aliidiomarina celeris]|uniref:flagellar export protein FliJ n=1 Tax=Aliidiomarina celeris TaxID=2249428 RepID=UPI000DE924C2|nr:flagellar export protein FliJ [Aliidiomarina celeris]